MTPESIDHPTRGPLTRIGFYVYGGEVDDPSLPLPDDGSQVTPALFRAQTFVVIGGYTSYKGAYDAWKAKAWATVDNAHARYRIAEVYAEDLPPLRSDQGLLPGTISNKIVSLAYQMGGRS
ncbi:hypothetical protein CcrC1_gp342 [Caulobacter phage C1]|nr:hypothetical protein CcrC1_gp342 [Caulobacter phage C1]UTU08571.1 hypothetical protein CcrC2_gp343 [Caulobacter phage C2]UTU09087.1 hypothetical protein CcrJ4_gp338 [Caulobacter phage J4]UTU10204.1 hypothetical protein CcrRB23_gp342 [Caulobacter phage RB23]UXY92612.1 hypothetical protein CcrBL47_gp360 [Caulobacter phage BL47]WGN97238.1 hypothetical protein [Bertelyvirus sp.]